MHALPEFRDGAFNVRVEKGGRALGWMEWRGFMRRVRSMERNRKMGKVSCFLGWID